MKIAMTAASQVHLPAWPRPMAASLCRIAGLLVAAGVPTLFWTVALMLLAKGAGIVIGVPALVAFGLIVAAWCLVGAAHVMGGREEYR